MLVPSLLATTSLVLQVLTMCKCNQDCHDCSYHSKLCTAYPKYCTRNSSYCRLRGECEEYYCGDGCQCDKCLNMTEDCSDYLHREICSELGQEEEGKAIEIMASLISLVVVILIATVSVTIICYWRYKFKMTRERLSHSVNESMQTNSYSTTLSDRVPASDPVYSELNGENSMDHYSHIQALSVRPPQLPTSQRPYYEEIDSDFKQTSLLSSATPTAYERPALTSPTETISKQFQENKSKREADGYQEPADALKMETITTHEEEEKQD